MKNLWIIPVLFLFFGCTGTGGMVDLDGNELANTATDRHTVWASVEKKKVDAVIHIADAEKAKAEAATAAKQNVVITINDKDSMALYQLGKANDQLTQMGTLLGEALIADRTGQSRYTAGLNFTPLPEGAFSEAIHATGDLLGDVLNTPVALAVGTGVVVNKAVQSATAGSGDTYNGDTTLTDSKNSSESHVTGSTSTTVSQTPKTVEPSVTVVDQPEPVIVTGGE